MEQPIITNIISDSKLSLESDTEIKKELKKFLKTVPRPYLPQFVALIQDIIRCKMALKLKLRNLLSVLEHWTSQKEPKPS